MVRFFIAACLFCTLTGCGTEGSLLSELRRETPAESSAENAGGEGGGVCSGEDGSPADGSFSGEGGGAGGGASSESAGENGGVTARGTDGNGNMDGDAGTQKNSGKTGGNTGQGAGTAVQTAEAGTDVDSVEGILVHVCGAVVKPGVYELPAGSRFYEAVDAAGGFAEGACQDYLNMAAPLVDGSRLEIPTEEEILAVEAAQSVTSAVEGENTKREYSYYTVPESPAQGADKGNASGDGTVNINTANTEELCSLPGIGEGRAKAIVEYREKQGGFQKKEDIMQVSGIGEKMYARMEEYLRVE